MQSFYLSAQPKWSWLFLLRPTKERVINANITSRLSFCNALLYGTSGVTPLLRELPRLPIVRSVDFKLLALTKPCIQTRQCNCVNFCARVIRQEHCTLRVIALKVKPTHTKAVNGSFAVTAVSLWNDLPTVY